MAKQTSLFLTKEIVNAGQTFSAFGESGIYKTIFTAGNDDSLVKSINVIATVTGSVAPATLTIPMQFAISGANRNEPTVIHPFTTVSIPPMAGSGAVPPIDILSASGSPSYPVDNAGKRYYPVESGAQLVARYMNNLGLNGQIVVTVIAENY
jgi:hypothetical protein